MRDGALDIGHGHDSVLIEGEFLIREILNVGATEGKVNL